MRAMEADLELKPQIIQCDFEKGAIKAFRLAFPGVKIIGCHFHFTSAIYKKACEFGLKVEYHENETFRLWIRMIIAMPFLMMDDIDDSKVFFIL